MKIYFKLTLIIFCLLIISSKIYSQSRASKWIDSVYNNMTPKERIAQLINVRVVSRTPSKNELTPDEIYELIKKDKIGGITFFQGTAEKQIELTNIFQQASEVPLIIGMDVEWGAGMRLKNVDNLPYQMTLGATFNPDLGVEYGRIIAEHCKRLGVHLCFAPVLDINSNPSNPVIGFRSLGGNKKWVTQFGVNIIKGIQKQGVIACIKHFPGHGDVNRDSHIKLPYIKKNWKALDSLDLIPFKEAIRIGTRALMVGHLYLSKDTFKKDPATISRDIVKRILIDSYQYRGLIITDAMEMKGFVKYVDITDAPVKALQAGNDILLLPINAKATIERIHEAVTLGEISKNELEQKVKKVLRYKYFYVINNNIDSIPTTNATKYLNNLVHTIKQDISDQAVTLLKSSKVTLEDYVKKNKNKFNYYLYLNNDNNDNDELGKLLKSSYHFKILSTNKKTKYTKIKKFLKKANDNASLIICLGGYSRSIKKHFGLNRSFRKVLKLIKKTPALLILMGNPYILNDINYKGDIIVTYENSYEMQKSVYKVLTNQIPALGHLPIMINKKYPLGYNFYNKRDLNKLDTIYKNRNKNNNRSYMTIIENKTLTQNVDKIVHTAIKNKVFPGCQVLIGRKNFLLMNKCYGTLDYTDSSNSVNPETIYDLASLTKIISTTLLTMKLFEKKQISLYLPISKYLPEYANKPIGQILIKDLMTHTSGLPAWIPFHEIIPKIKEPMYLSEVENDTYNIKVANALYTSKKTEKYILDSIANTPLNSSKPYLYSDLGIILLGKIIERIKHKSLDSSIKEEITIPLGLKNTEYNIWKTNKNLTKIVAPTEDDDYFRHQRVQGYVHDYTAALLGGVAGHAGLFSNTNDMAIICRMFLNNGYHNLTQIYKPSTIKIFTSKFNNKSKRGLGFNRPDVNNVNTGFPSHYCSQSTFGHRGFTGTCLWIDPKNDIYFIFLSNRTFPKADNNLLHQYKIREKIFDAIYQSIN